MIVTKIICDMCGKDCERTDVLPMKFSTDNLSFRDHTSKTLNERPSVIIMAPEYIQLCRICSYKVLGQIAFEQKWEMNK